MFMITAFYDFFKLNSLTHKQLTLNKKEIRCNGTKLLAKLVYGLLTR